MVEEIFQNPSSPDLAALPQVLECFMTASLEPDIAQLQISKELSISLRRFDGNPKPKWPLPRSLQSLLVQGVETTAKARGVSPQQLTRALLSTVTYMVAAQALRRPELGSSSPALVAIGILVSTLDGLGLEA